jgi:type II secretory pathway pseudopilin PulG
MKKAFTIMELLVAIGLLAAVLAASSMVFNYSIDAQRKAGATAEIMRTLRAITDQLNIDFQGLQKDGYLILYSKENGGNNFDALYFFSISEGNFFQSWYDSDIRSNMARIFLGHSRTTFNSGQLPGNLALDFLLLTPGLPPPPVPSDCRATSFAECQPDMTDMTSPITDLSETPADVLSNNLNARPDTSSTDVRSLLAQNVGSFEVEWTYGWVDSTAPDKILWWGLGSSLSDAVAAGTNFLYPDGTPVPAGEAPARIISINETLIPGPPPYYTVEWNTNNQLYWPKALKFTFTLYDSKGIIKNGRRFEHIVYIGK